MSTDEWERSRREHKGKKELHRRRQENGSGTLTEDELRSGAETKIKATLDLLLSRVSEDTATIGGVKYLILEEERDLHIATNLGKMGFKGKRITAQDVENHKINKDRLGDVMIMAEPFLVRCREVARAHPEDGFAGNLTQVASALNIDISTLGKSGHA